MFLQPPGEVEQFIPLLSGDSFCLESIVSHGQSGPPDFWYDQDTDEWIALLKGEATLEFRGGEPLRLIAGDFLLINARCKHRVATTSPDAVWLALHFSTQKPEKPERD